MSEKGRFINPPARRRPEAAQPATPPPAIVTWVASFGVQDAKALHDEAVRQMKREGAEPDEIETSLRPNNVIDASACLHALLGPMSERIAGRARIEVTDTDLYTEPATETT